MFECQITLVIGKIKSHHHRNNVSKCSLGIKHETNSSIMLSINTVLFIVMSLLCPALAWNIKNFWWFNIPIHSCKILFPSSYLKWINIVLMSSASYNTWCTISFTKNVKFLLYWQESFHFDFWVQWLQNMSSRYLTYIDHFLKRNYGTVVLFLLYI